LDEKDQTTIRRREPDRPLYFNPNQVSGETLTYLSYAVIALGGAIGWRLTNTRRVTGVAVRALAVAFAGFFLVLLAEYLDSTNLGFIAVGIVAASIGVGGGATIRAFLGWDKAARVKEAASRQQEQP